MEHHGIQVSNENISNKNVSRTKRQYIIFFIACITEYHDHGLRHIIS